MSTQRRKSKSEYIGSISFQSTVEFPSQGFKVKDEHPGQPVSLNHKSQLVPNYPKSSTPAYGHLSQENGRQHSADMAQRASLGEKGEDPKSVTYDFRATEGRE